MLQGINYGGRGNCSKFICGSIFFSMAIIKVQKMKLVAQPKNGLCWWASCQMLYLWSQATGKGSMVDPIADETGFKVRYDGNLNWFCGDNTYMANKMSMVTIPSLSLDFSSVNSALSSHGPIFTSVQKNWNGNNYAHAVVIGGVADTGVFIYDPMPVGKGSSLWLTWDQIQSAVDYVSDVANPSFLAAA